MDTSSVVKAVRLDNETIQRITAHMVRLQALWGPAVWVNEGMALRDVILKGLDVAEGAAQQAPEAPIPATAPIAVEEVIPPGVPIEPIPQHMTITPEASTEETPEPAPEATRTVRAPRAPRDAPAHLRAIAGAYPQATHLSLDEFAEVLYERNIYRAIDKGGHERPVNRGTLKKMLDRCKKLGLLR